MYEKWKFLNYHLYWRPNHSLSIQVKILSYFRKLIQETVENFNRIDAIFLNAGINSHFEFKDIKDTSIFQTLMNTNFYANVNLTQAVLPYIKHSNGKIIVISSLSGKFGLPSRTAYCASKFALNGFFEALRTEEDI